MDGVDIIEEVVEKFGFFVLLMFLYFLGSLYMGYVCNYVIIDVIVWV